MHNEFCNGDCIKGRDCKCAAFRAAWWVSFSILVMLLVLVVGMRMTPVAVDWLVN